jgi:aminoglycoside phosphotransferase (APT) family kinase protein
MPGWSLFSVEARDTFRALVGADDPMWARGRGWALAQAVIALPYYRDTNPTMAATARHAIAEVLAG